MSASNELRVRPSVRDLQAQYDSGNKKPLEDLVRAWIGIMGLSSDDPKSLFVLGGYHGEPFKYRKEVDDLSEVDTYTYWGGYCNHGNVLFPTWHRAYVLKLEEALQSIVPDVMMPFWDETSEDSYKHGIPSILTQEKFELDGVEIDNPLRSFTLPEALDDELGDDNQIYAKPKGYRTVRYPLSGLVGTADAEKATKEHNARFPDPSENTELLNENVVAWLKGGHPTDTNPNPTENGIRALFERCLGAPNYTVFSNNTSASEWNKTHPGTEVSLEAPHNDIHLAVGGFDTKEGESGQIAGANGDMGENNTAAMDPIFFFHHCNVDRMFWLWQKRHGQTDADAIDVIDGYKGTSSSDTQGPIPGVAPGNKLNLDTDLVPFTKPDNSFYTSKDCINIETQLGFTYGAGSLEDAPERMSAEPGSSTTKLTAFGIDRALFQGSFVVRAYATVTDADGASSEHYLGHYSVLSRRNVNRCANCLTHLEVVAHFPLSDLPEDSVDGSEYRIEYQHRGTGVPLVGLRQVAAPLPEGLKSNLKVTD